MRQLLNGHVMKEKEREREREREREDYYFRKIPTKI